MTGPEHYTAAERLLEHAIALGQADTSPDPVQTAERIQYEPLSACHLADPAADWQRPSPEALARAWQDFLDTEHMR